MSPASSKGLITFIAPCRDNDGHPELITGKGSGIGLQIRVHDLDGNGWKDIIGPGKSGNHIIWNDGKESTVDNIIDTPNAPKGHRPPAQGCGNAATLGNRSAKPVTPTGVAPNTDATSSR